MKVRKPSDWAKMDNQAYLGHFRQDKYLNEGHNRCEGAADKAKCEEMFAGYDAADKAKSDAKEAKYKGMSPAGAYVQRGLDKARGED
jgi:hypothetical protein